MPLWVGGPTDPLFPVDVAFGAAAIEQLVQRQAAQVQSGGGWATGSGCAGDAPRWWRWGAVLPGFPVASPFSVGVELKPPGVDQRWVRIWLLDRSALFTVHCRLVVRSAAVQRAGEVQAAYGAAAEWWV
jgi:hypothetical protein